MIAPHGYPVPTPEQARLGAQLYTRLGMTVGSYIEWFTEGVPSEWEQALRHIQEVLTEVKREAAKAAAPDRPGPAAPLPLFDLHPQEEMIACPR